ncbi:Phage minor tail protein L [compost metagenome]
MTAYCHWAMTNGYRGVDCGYTGLALFDEDDMQVSDPAKDQCGGSLASCKKRFGANNELPYGGFPAVSLIARN